VVAVSLFAEVMLALSTIVFVSTGAVFLTVRTVVKRVRRNRALGGAALRTRAQLSWGPQREVRSLQVQLHDAMDSGAAAIELLDRGAGPRGELQRLFRRIQGESVALDAQLRLLSTERDASVLAEETPLVGQRIDQITGMVRRLRAAVAAGISGYSDNNLTMLKMDVDREIAALDAGVQELNALYGSERPSGAYNRPTTSQLNHPLPRGNES